VDDETGNLHSAAGPDYAAARNGKKEAAQPALMTECAGLAAMVVSRLPDQRNQSIPEQSQASPAFRIRRGSTDDI
jgi:hypothetical protein